MVGLIFYLSKMSFIKLIKDSEEGLKRKISSRREKIIVSIEEFNKLSNKYFFKIKEGENLIFNFNEKDEEILLFVLSGITTYGLTSKKIQLKFTMIFQKNLKL